MLADLLLRVCMTVQGTLFPLYVIEKGFSPTIAGLTTTAFMLAAFAFRPVSGKLVDSIGRQQVLLLGAAVYFISSGASLIDIPAGLLLTMRGVQGCGFCFFGTALMTLATDIIPKNRMSEGIGYIGLTRTIAGAFPPILALALKDAYGYPISFAVAFGISFLALLSGIPLNLGKRNTAHSVTAEGFPGVRVGISFSPSRNRVQESLWDKIVDRDALKPSSIMLFFMFANSWVGTFLVAYAVSKGIANPGVFFTANAIATAVARLAVGKLSQHFGSVAVLAPGIALASLSLVGMFSSANAAILILSGALYGMGMGMVQPELNSLSVLAARDERRGLANSTFFMAMDLGMAVGASTMGVVASYAGMGFIFLLGAMLTALILFGYLVLDRKGYLHASSV